MGFFKKIFKPVSKVLDKIIPNEIKPALPYAAAFMPFIPGFQGAASGLGSFLKAGKYANLVGGGVLGGGGNILAQLAQEGNEGDINALSAGLGTLTGVMGAAQPGQLGGMTTQSTIDPAIDATQRAKILSDRGLLTKASDAGLNLLEKGSGIMRAGIDEPFSKAGLKAATLPAATATGTLMEADARRLEKQSIIDAALDEAAALGDTAASALAIRNAMEAYGFFSEDEILSTIESAGYRAGGRVGFDNGGDVEKELDTVLVMIEGPDGVEVKEVLKSEALRENLKIVSDTGEFNQYRFDNVENKKAGGRVGFRFGGIDEAIESVQEETIEKGKDGIMTAAKEDPLLVEEYNKYVFDLMEQRPDAKPMSFQDFKRMIMSGMKDGGIMATEIPLKDSVKNINKKGQPDTTMVKMKEGGLMDLGGKEMDLRGGGFVPIGKKEKADDVPARLSKNEFVMTADAVRAAGGGSVNKGAKRMYDVMNKLEARA